MLVNTGKGAKKEAPLSRCIPPETGSGRINAPHGGRNLKSLYRLCLDIKNARSKVIWRAILACFKCSALQIWGFLLE